MRPPHRSGLTLTELLVVLGIVAILIAILIPSVNAARRRSQVTLCASNLRQIGQALHAYRAEHRRWPDAAPIPAPFIYPVDLYTTRPLPDVLDRYLPSRSAVYRCPGDQEVFDPVAAEHDGLGISYNYWTPYNLPKPHDFMVTDFQGYRGPLRNVEISAFHPPRRGMNHLWPDGRVEFFHNAP